MRPVRSKRAGRSVAWGNTLRSAKDPPEDSVARESVDATAKTRRSASAGAATRKSATGDKAAGGERDMGASLRRVYQRTVEEAIPDDLLSLLGKLD